MNNVINDVIKPYLFWFMVIILGMLSGTLLGASVAIAVKTIKSPPIQIISLNEESLFREQALKCAELNLDEKSLQKKLSDFKKAFMDLLKNLPPHYVVVRSNLLLRYDNVLDLTESFKSLLIVPEEKGLKK